MYEDLKMYFTEDWEQRKIKVGEIYMYSCNGYLWR